MIIISLEVISPNEFEVVLYLNQMGVFNFVDDGTLPGCAVLKAQACCDKIPYRDTVKMMPDTSEVKLRIRERYIVQITPGIIPDFILATLNLVAEVKARKLQFTKQRMSSASQNGYRKKCLSILKTLRDRHLDLPGAPINEYHMKTLLLYECEKHPRDTEWEEVCMATQQRRRRPPRS
ncbi:hypothetical protein DERP_011069 [Dermatophagoides pteronyssinus]|uniref:Mab-21-like HhH/H2TH-like domain-containing protein n=1 Tax=Dermatophagoides pteronyssinus TaxID=6956 RepID=A0ABQ8J9D9_DERPT|nr:hypothetical protein DERP_011069 [Dermatophagoides pteronyssinus]